MAVVAIHISAAVLLNTPIGTRGFLFAGFLNQASRFAVPAFILITGAGLFHSYGRRSDFSTRQYYLRRLKSLGIPYLFWSTVYFASSVDGNFADLAPRFLVALATASASYTFYFFPIILPFYLLFPLVRRLTRTRWMDLAVAIAVVGNGFLVWFSFPHPKMPLGALLSQAYAYAGITPLWWMGPFFLGAWLNERWEVVGGWVRRFWYIPLTVAGILGFWVMQEFNAYVQVGRLAYVATNFRPSAYWYGLAIMVAAIGLGEVIVRRGGFLRSLLLDFGKCSFGVYLVHPLVMLASAKLLGYFALGPVLLLGLNLALTLIGSYLLTRLIQMVPGGNSITGGR